MHGFVVFCKLNVIVGDNKYLNVFIFFFILHHFFIIQFLSNRRLKTVFSTYVGKITYTHGYHLHHLSETVLLRLFLKPSHFWLFLNIENAVSGYRVLKHNYFSKVSIWYFWGFGMLTQVLVIFLLEHGLRGMGICNVD